MKWFLQRSALIVETNRVDYSKEVTMKRVWFLVAFVSIALFIVRMFVK